MTTLNFARHLRYNLLYAAFDLRGKSSSHRKILALNCVHDQAGWKLAQYTCKLDHLRDAEAMSRLKGKLGGNWLRKGIQPAYRAGLSARRNRIDHDDASGLPRLWQVYTLIGALYEHGSRQCLLFQRAKDSQTDAIITAILIANADHHIRN